MRRDPIAALIKLAGLEVDRARAAHARALAEVNRSAASINLLHKQISLERAESETTSGAAMGLAEAGLQALYISLNKQQALKAGLEAKATVSLHQLNLAILADERYAVYQARILQETKRKRQRREAEAQDDLHLARLRLNP